jgi:uncharacterized protein DUF4129
MLLQAAERWSTAAIHDTVATLLRDRAYHRSFWSSLLGKLLTLIGRFLNWLFDAARSIPGGRNTVITFVVVVIALIILRVLMTGQWDDDLAMRRRTGKSRVSRMDPWAEAEALAAAGDFTGAAHALYQAVLRRIAATERVRLHTSKTTGDYARELRRRGSPVAGPFQAFGRRFDRVIFGVGECSPDEFAAMLRDAAAIPDMREAA